LIYSGTWILSNVTPAALLVPIAGLGLAFLGLEQATYSVAAPIVGKNLIALLFLSLTLTLN